MLQANLAEAVTSDGFLTLNAHIPPAA